MTITPHFGGILPGRAKPQAAARRSPERPSSKKAKRGDRFHAMVAGERRITRPHYLPMPKPGEPCRYIFDFSAPLALSLSTTLAKQSLQPGDNTVMVAGKPCTVSWDPGAGKARMVENPFEAVDIPLSFLQDDEQLVFYGSDADAQPVKWTIDPEQQTLAVETSTQMVSVPPAKRIPIAASVNTNALTGCGTVTEAVVEGVPMRFFFEFDLEGNPSVSRVEQSGEPLSMPVSPQGTIEFEAFGQSFCAALDAKGCFVTVADAETGKPLAKTADGRWIVSADEAQGVENTLNVFSHKAPAHARVTIKAQRQSKLKDGPLWALNLAQKAAGALPGEKHTLTLEESNGLLLSLNGEPFAFETHDNGHAYAGVSINGEEYVIEFTQPAEPGEKPQAWLHTYDESYDDVDIAEKTGMPIDLEPTMDQQGWRSEFIDALGESVLLNLSPANIQEVQIGERGYMVALDNGAQRVHLIDLESDHSLSLPLGQATEGLILDQPFEIESSRIPQPMIISVSSKRKQTFDENNLLETEINGRHLVFSQSPDTGNVSVFEVLDPEPGDDDQRGRLAPYPLGLFGNQIPNTNSSRVEIAGRPFQKHIDPSTQLPVYTDLVTGNVFSGQWIPRDEYEQLCEHYREQTAAQFGLSADDLGDQGAAMPSPVAMMARMHAEQVVQNILSQVAVSQIEDQLALGDPSPVYTGRGTARSDKILL